MKLITRDTDYAVRALGYIASRKSRTITVRQLSAALKMPQPFLRKILQTLHRNGLLKSRKGRGGGFELGLSPERIYLTDVIEIFQGAFRLNECLFKKDICPNTKRCALKKKLDEIERYVLQELKSITVAHLL